MNSARLTIAALTLCFAASVQVAAQDELRGAIAADYRDKLEALFIHFHENPELSHREFETSKRLAAEIRALGFEVTEGVAGAFGGDVLWDEPREGMGAEDFAYPVTPESGVKDVYFNVGGTLPENVDGAALHHSPFFRIEPEPAITMATEAMVRAAVDLFGQATERSGS